LNSTSLPKKSLNYLKYYLLLLAPLKFILDKITAYYLREKE